MFVLYKLKRKFKMNECFEERKKILTDRYVVRKRLMCND